MKLLKAIFLLKRLFKIFKAKTQNIIITNSNSSETNKTIRKWNKSDTAYSTAGFKEYWELLEDVQRYEALLMANGMDILEYVLSFFPKGKKISNLNGLIIGCTYGNESPAISIAKSGAFRKLLILDIAPGLLKSQEKITDKIGLNHVFTYKQMDLNAGLISDENIYDFIFANGTIHHIESLERLFFDINKSLQEDGLFCMKEYVGPSYLQFTEKQLQIANKILQILPDYLKKQKIGIGIIKPEIFRPSLAEIMVDDPSEAVRSKDIMGVVQTYLNVLTCNPTGGTILHPLLSAIAGNFEKGDAERAILKTIIITEQILIEEGVIPSDYVFLIAKKKK